MELRRLLSEILENEGFRIQDAPPLEGQSGATYPTSLIAEREDGFFLVDTLGTRAVTPQDLEALASIVDDTRVDGAILFALDGLTPETNPDSVEHVHVWDEARTKQAIGTQLLAWIDTGDEILETIGPTSPRGEPATSPDTTPPPSTKPRSTTVESQPSASSNGAATPSDPDATPSLPGVQPPAQEAETSANTDQDVPPEDAPSEEETVPVSTAQTEPEPDSDAEILTDESTDPEPEATPEPPTADAVADDGSDAEILTDEPTKETRQAQDDPGQQPHQTSPTPGQESGPDGGQFVSPEEMARRAKEMLDKGEIPEDGDAEIIVEDDTAQQAPDPEPATTDEPEPQAAAEPEQPPEPEPSAQADADQSPMDRLEDGQEFEDGDCELLPSKPRDKPSEEAANDAPEPRSPPQEAQPEPSTETPTSDREEERSIEETAMAAASPAQAAGVPDEDEEPFLSGGLLEPKLDEEEARREAQAALFQVSDARLELLPFHVFEYECILEGGNNKREEQGRVWVSAQSGIVVTDPGGTLIDDPGVPHERFQAKLDAREAIAKAKPRLEEQLETREELRDDYSETAIIERVTLTPREGSLELNHLGTAFAPRWRVEGQNGTVFVDALTGDLVSG